MWRKMIYQVSFFSVGFEKAFDSIDWKYLYNALKCFGFSEGIVDWIKLFYNDISSRTINNGWASSTFNISRGLRQGCPLSPYLYVICAELLAIRLRNSDIVEGIKILDHYFLLSQFADDTQFFLNGTAMSLNASLSLLEDFEKNSGLKINYEKSECFKIGQLRNNRRHFPTTHNIKWSKGPINVLGMKIPITDKHKIYQLNIDEKITQIRKTINFWMGRKLSLFGKVNILKSQILSKLTYALSVLPNLPVHYLEELQSVFYHFIWDFKIDRIKRNIQINNLKNGGISAPDLASYEKSLKMNWIKRYVNGTQSPWKIFLNKTLEEFGGELIFNCNLVEQDNRLNEIKNLFHRDLLKKWFLVNPWSEDINNHRINSKIIWNNKNIKVYGKTVCYKDWLEKGICMVGDLFKDGNLMDVEEFKIKYGLQTNCLTYFGLCTAIPREWKNRIVNERQNRPLNIYSNDFFYLINTEKPNRYFYWKLVNNNGKFPFKIFNKWKSVFPNLLCNDLNAAFVLIPKTTIEIKIRNFQYKFLHRILPNNKLLYYMQKVDSSTCAFCKQEEDSLEHMFWNCSITQKFLHEIKLYLGNTFGEDFNLRKQEFFLGILGTEDYKLINHIYFLIKFYVFRCFISKSIPGREAFIFYLKQFVCLFVCLFRV